MKRIITLLLMVALAAMLTGCVQMHMDTTIKKDGSGTMDMTLSLSKVLTDAIAEMGTEDMDDDIGEITEIMDMDKKELKKSLKGHDVKLKEFKKDIVEGRETLNISMEFKTLESLSFALREVMGGEDQGMAILDNGDGNYVLRPHEYDWPALEVEEEEAEEETVDSMDDMDPAKMQKQMELMGKLMGAMGEIDISMKITVPGDIVDSNAPTVEGRTSIWAIDSTNMMSADSNMEPNIVFSSKGLKLKPVK